MTELKIILRYSYDIANLHNNITINFRKPYDILSHDLRTILRRDLRQSYDKS